jgi:hypothetical protein
MRSNYSRRKNREKLGATVKGFILDKRYPAFIPLSFEVIGGWEMHK